MKLKKNTLLIFIFFLITTGNKCGYYSFSGSSLPSNIRTVAVPMFENKTSEFGVREDITDALMVSGTIVNIREQAGAYNTDEKVNEIRVYVSVQAKFEDLKKHKVIWEESITQWGTYNPNLPPGDEGSTRQDGINEAVEKIVADIFNKTVSGW